MKIIKTMIGLVWVPEQSEPKILLQPTHFNSPWLEPAFQAPTPPSSEVKSRPMEVHSTSLGVRIPPLVDPMTLFLSKPLLPWIHSTLL